MSDFYQQGGHRPSQGGQYYAPPQEYGGHHPSYGNSDAYSQASYPPQPQSYANYGPPRPDSAGRYRGSPTPQNMQMAPAYRQDDYYYDDQRRHSGSGHHHHHHEGSISSDRGYEPVRSGERGFEVKPQHSQKKDIGAMIAGGVVGAFAGHELGHGGMATLIGAAAGAYGGHEIEKHREKKKDEKARRESEAAYDDGYGRRSMSRDGRRSISRDRRGSRGSGRRSVSSDSGSSVDSRRRSHHH